ncbi:MAG: bifunctional 4-hydroxy-2-oxoglutarate aldolase/2-dehydro-3-deoxy-phosphogluconate aldolase [Candidatus Omnitrophota bacterium]
MGIDGFSDLPILGILRGIKTDSIEPLTESMISAGLKTAEITMNTAGAPDLLRRMARCAGDRLNIGAGTVMSTKDLQSALDAGAQFIVLPTLVEDVVKLCVKEGIPVFPGAFTPQEIYNAWSMGATMVKVFPAKFFGPAYIKELKGPFNDIKLLACGGVGPGNVAEFFSAGASAVAFGGSVFKSDWLERGEFGNIEKAIKGIVAAYTSNPGPVKIRKV